MKRRKSTAFLATLTGILLASLGAARAGEVDRCEAPSLEITGESGSAALPLESTSAEVRVSGVIADVTLKQVYRNPLDHPIEARYVFPMSTRAAVHGMRFQIGDRVVESVIRRKEDAERVYIKAKQEGRKAAVVHQHRPNVFETKVANIPPHGAIEVTLNYTEHVEATDKVYEFALPAVVVERFGSGPGGAPVEWASNPYIKDENDSFDGKGSPSPQAFDLTVDVDAGLPLQELACTSHRVNTTFENKSRAKVVLDRSEEPNAGNRDFILRYRLAGDAVDAGLLVYEDEKHGENFFLLNIQPPTRVRPDQVPPREFVFVVDVSGSMHGFPLDTSKQMLRELIGGLKPEERFNVLLFAGGSNILGETSVAATPENIDRALALIDRSGAGGSTEMTRALERAFSLPGEDGFSRSLILVTDGFVNFEKDAFELVRSRLGDANVFAFGIGGSVNRFLIEGVARAGKGEPFVVTNAQEAPDTARRFREYVRSPVLTDIRIDYGGMEVYDLEPRSIPDVLADRPVTVFGKWRGALPETITLHGRGGEDRDLAVPLKVEAAKESRPSALPYLWARTRIRNAADYRQLTQREGDVREEITELGLKYNLLTDYTSFVAVEEIQMVENGAPVRHITPEPGATLLLVLGLVATALLRGRRRA